MPGRRKRANRTANASIYHVYKYFQKGSMKSKDRGPAKITSKNSGFITNNSFITGIYMYIYDSNRGLFV